MFSELFFDFCFTRRTNCGITMEMTAANPTQQELVERMGCQDREAAAEFIESNREQIMHALSGRTPELLRPVEDTAVLFATVERRFDMLIASGRANPRCVYDAMRLIDRIVNEAVVDLDKAIERLSYQKAGELPDELIAVIKSENGDLKLQDLLDRLDPTRRTILILLLRGNSIKYVIAPLVGIKYDSVRKILQGIREELREYAKPNDD